MAGVVPTQGMIEKAIQSIVLAMKAKTTANASGDSKHLEQYEALAQAATDNFNTALPQGAYAALKHPLRAL